MELWTIFTFSVELGVVGDMIFWMLSCIGKYYNTCSNP